MPKFEHQLLHPALVHWYLVHWYQLQIGRPCANGQLQEEGTQVLVRNF